MKRVAIILLLPIFFTSMLSCQNRFDKKVWLENNDLLTKNNPRYDMVEDLMKKHLKAGMSKNSVLKLLGKPHSDTISLRLPKGLKVPDSLSNDKILRMPKEKRDHYLNLLNEWYRSNYISTKMLKYIVGWSLSDPVFLELEFDNENHVVDFWVKEY